MSKSLTTRLANIDDMKSVFDLSNDDIVRANSIHSEKIEWENHIVWFKSKLDSKDIVFYILEIEDNFAGYYHIDKEANDEWLVTIHISKAYRSKNLGFSFLKTTCESNSDKNIIAYIKTSNVASKKIFEKNNFQIFDIITINSEKYYLFKKAKAKAK